MQPCIWTDVLREWPPEEALRIIGAAGFRQVEFGLRHEISYLEGKEDEGWRLSRITAAAQTANVEIIQMHGHMFNLCDADADEHIAWALRSIKRAAALGVKWIVFHPGSVAEYNANPAAFEMVRKRNVEVFLKLAITAENAGTGIAIENMTGTPLRFGATVSDILWLHEQLAGHRVGICWDTGHAHLAGVNQSVALQCIGSRLVALHIHDNDGNKDQHWTPMRGQIKWQPILTALQDIGFAGAFNLEVPGEWRVTPMAAREALVHYLFQVCRAMLHPSFLH